MDLNRAPQTPDGTPLTEQYWQKIMPIVNKCGDRLLDIFSEYQHISYANTSKLEKCGEDISRLISVYGEVPMAVNIVVFYDGGCEYGVDVFSANIKIFYNTMDEDMMITVERLRYINTKYQERVNSIAGQLRGRGIAFKTN